jgi:hypothetical protein
VGTHWETPSSERADRLPFGVNRTNLRPFPRNGEAVEGRRVGHIARNLTNLPPFLCSGEGGGTVCRSVFSCEYADHLTRLYRKHNVPCPNVPMQAVGILQHQGKPKIFFPNCPVSRCPEPGKQRNNSIGKCSSSCSGIGTVQAEKRVNRKMSRPMSQYPKASKQKKPIEKISFPMSRSRNQANGISHTEQNKKCRVPCPRCLKPSGQLSLHPSAYSISTFELRSNSAS